VKCAVCSIDLTMMDRQGVEIDDALNAAEDGWTAGNSTRSLSVPTHLSVTADLSNMIAIITTITTSKANITCPSIGGGRVLARMLGF
jgi:hypothetical protein